MGEHQDGVDIPLCEKIAQDELLGLLDKHKDGLLAALKSGAQTHTWGSLINGLFEQELQFWDHPRGCAVTEVLDWPNDERWVHVFLAAGDMDALLDLEGPVEYFARQIGAKRLTFTGRKGFRRVLKHWSEPVVTMQRELV